MNTRRNLPWFVIAALLCAAGCSRQPQFDLNRIKEGVRVLSSDDFEGRAPATAGEQKTVAYLIDQLKTAGLEPGGDPQPGAGRAWTQDVPLVRSQIEGAPDIEVQAGKDKLKWNQGEQVAIRATQTGEDQVTIVNAPLVFVGYGVSAPERNWDDYKGVDLHGKIALMLVNDPDFESGQGDFGGKAMTYYGRWTYKYEEAARRGAVGALVIHETAAASYGWDTVKNSNTVAMFDVQRANPLETHVTLEGWIQRDVTVDLLKRAGLDFDKLKAEAATRDFKPVTLANVTLNADFAVRRDQVVSKNVIGVLPGQQHADEWVIYTAHWDHFGIGEPENGDAIYNGAVDNAAGCAQLLEIARAFAKAPRTQRSLAFLFVTAEERGLLGSEYYAMNPLYPLAKTVANLNTDAPAPTAPARDFATAGSAAVTLQDDLAEEGRKFHRSYTPDAHPEAGHFFRSDHFSFAKRGVPAISFDSGEDLTEGGKAAGEAWFAAYERDRYHRPSDQLDASWRFDGIAADASLLYALGRRLADSREWPEWKAGSEFKAVRDASAAERK